MVAVGDKFPNVALQKGPFPPTEVNMPERLAGKKTIVVGLPGAFTPTWSTCQVPGFLGGQDALKAAGIDEVLVFCVNDTQVMEAWALDMKIAGSNMTFLGDPNGEVAKALGMVLTDPGPVYKLGPNRSKRFSIYCDDGVIKVIALSEGPGDPAGDDDPSNSCIDSVLAKIAAL